MRNIVVLVSVFTTLIALSGCTAVKPTPPIISHVSKPVLSSPLNPATTPEALKYCPVKKASNLHDLELNLRTIKTVYVCGKIAEDGTVNPNIVQKVSGGLHGLLLAYDKPNAFKNPKVICPALAADPNIVWIETQGQLIPIYAPVTDCGFPNSSSVKAFNSLKLTQVSFRS